MELPSIWFALPTGIICRGVSCFVTDCPCGVWCHGLIMFPCIWQIVLFGICIFLTYIDIHISAESATEVPLSLFPLIMCNLQKYHLCHMISENSETTHLLHGCDKWYIILSRVVYFMAKWTNRPLFHYIDVIMTTMPSQITSLTVVYSAVYSDADQRKHQSSVSLAFVWGIHRDRWIPRTKGQLRGKYFHLMTSSCRWPNLISQTFDIVLYPLRNVQY